MTEVATKSALRKLPLNDVHRRIGATMTERQGWLLPEKYGKAAAEYAAVRDGDSGVIDLSSRGRILVRGSEAVMFLNGLITNDVKALAKNSWMPAAFPNVQGRLLAAARLLNRGDDFLIDTESVTQETILQLLNRFTLAGDFRVTDVTESMAMISVQGSHAGEIIRTLLNDSAADIKREQIIKTGFSDHAKVTIIRATHTAEDGFDLFIESAEAEPIWLRLIENGAVPVGYGPLELLRIEAGIPRYGVDMDETNVVTEANLDDAVSFTKGCYVGQEIIARIKYRGHVAKKLTGLILDQQAAVALESRARIYSDDDKEIGRVTSSTFSPHLERTIGLGYVKYDYLAPWTSVKVTAGELKVAGKIAELPVVRGSWYGA